MPIVHVNNIDMHYQTHGTGPSLLILGGLGDSSRNWFGIASQLGKHFHIVTPDNRGSGQTEKASGPYSIEMMANDHAALIKKLGMAPCHVLGFSMGGRIAMQLTLSQPELVDRLILVSTGPGWHHPYSPAPEVIRIMESHKRTDKHFEEQYSILYGKAYQQKFPASGFVKFKHADPHPQPEECFAAQLAAVRNFDLSSQIQKITKKTLILAGTDDAISDYRNSELMKEKIPNSQLKLYEGLGHVLQGEDTKRFLSDVIHFLQN